MNPLRILFPSAVALALASCASKNQYDTSSPYGPADASAGNAAYQPAAPSNQTYDTPAAYEDAGGAPADTSVNLPPSGSPNVAGPKRPGKPTAAEPAPAPASGGIATTHTVVKGDTLSGISKKYKVPVASIKAANGMTKDTVVLGKQLKIPAH